MVVRYDSFDGSFVVLHSITEGFSVVLEVFHELVPFNFGVLGVRKRDETVFRSDVVWFVSCHKYPFWDRVLCCLVGDDCVTFGLMVLLAHGVVVGCVFFR